MPRPKKGSKETRFEDALDRLEEIVKSLEEGDLPLEDSLKLFEEGVGLTRLCSSRLDEAQRRIDVLTRGEGGDPRLLPFASPDEEAGPDTGRPDSEEE
jgi:exodeoxyribonuclease VII small subunit